MMVSFISDLQDYLIMMIISLLFTILVASQSNANEKTNNPTNENNRPIIGKWLRLLDRWCERCHLGILTQPAPADWKKPNRTTYLAASYVKYVESTGAQVVPIR